MLGEKEYCERNGHQWERKTHRIARDSNPYTPVRTEIKPPYWWDAEAIAVDVKCDYCGEEGVELWIYSHTQTKSK